jgi:uridine phosphorylase
MNFPNTPDKYSYPAVFSASDVLARRRQVGDGPVFPCPETVIFCYHGPLLRYAAKTQRGRKVGGFYGETYLLRKTDNQVAVAGSFGLGAPVTTVLLEDFAAYGVRQFIAVGIAGGLQAGQRTGDIVVAERAIRDEGTSYHYIPPGRTIKPPGRITAKIRGFLAAADVLHDTGTSWTTDAPYRETAVEIQRYQAEGIKTVEMEAAALFAVGSFLGVEAAAIFVIGDILADGHWHMASDFEQSLAGLRSVFDALIRGLNA